MEENVGVDRVKFGDKLEIGSPLRRRDRSSKRKIAQIGRGFDFLRLHSLQAIHIVEDQSELPHPSGREVAEHLTVEGCVPRPGSRAGPGEALISVGEVGNDIIVDAAVRGSVKVTPKAPLTVTLVTISASAEGNGAAAGRAFQASKLRLGPRR